MRLQGQKGLEVDQSKKIDMGSWCALWIKSSSKWIAGQSQCASAMLNDDPDGAPDCFDSTNDQLAQAMAMAAITHKPKCFKRALESWPGALELDGTGATPLHLCVHAGFVQGALMACEAGWDPSKDAGSWGSAMAMAQWAGDVAMQKALEPSYWASVERAQIEKSSSLGKPSDRLRM